MKMPHGKMNKIKSGLSSKVIFKDKAVASCRSSVVASTIVMKHKRLQSANGTENDTLFANTLIHIITVIEMINHF